MCKQFFPWLQVVYPYYTGLQGGKSTTTGEDNGDCTNNTYDTYCSKRPYNTEVE